MKRRQILTIIGGGVVLAAGFAGWRYQASRTPTAALAPWHRAGSAYVEPRKRVLSYALLAPNPHNRQPWLVDLDQADRIILYADPERRLPETDPYDRQITIGLGCFIELMVMAAAAHGFRVDLDPFPEGEDEEGLDNRPVLVARFEQDATLAPDPLFGHVPERRSLKEPYALDQPVASGALSQLEAASTHGGRVGSSNEQAMVERLRTLTREAMLIEIETPRTFKESVDLFRIGKAEIEANPDGIDFPGTMFELMNKTGLFTREATLDPSSTAYSQGRDAVLANVDTAMAHIWQVSETNSRTDQINAGRDWARINLAATELGLGTQPLSQALQEYPEMSQVYDRVHQLLAPEGGTVQMLARLGYGPVVGPSPRWPLETRLIEPAG
ncbi:MAG: Acg family FMN-binding oxidoreductase [Geminicoccaceae bacterium]